MEVFSVCGVGNGVFYGAAGMELGRGIVVGFCEKRGGFEGR